MGMGVGAMADLVLLAGQHRLVAAGHQGPDRAGGRIGAQVHAGRRRLSQGHGQRIGAGWGGFGEQAGRVEEGQVGGQHDVLGPQAAVGSLDRAREAKPDVQGSGLLEHSAAVAVDRLGQAHTEPAGMELGLILEADRPLDRERQADVGAEGGGQASLLGCFHLLLDSGDSQGVLGVGVGGKGLEVTVQAQLLDQALDQRQAFLVGLTVGPGTLLPEGARQLGVGQAVQGGDLGGGVAGHPAGHPAGLDHGHGDAGLLEQHGGGQTGDSPAEHGHIDPQFIPLIGGKARFGRRRDPVGDVPVRAAHPAHLPSVAQRSTVRATQQRPGCGSSMARTSGSPPRWSVRP
jgi:hypothetical protein